MKEIFFTPGPSQLHPTVPKAIEQALKENICSISHRSKDFETISESGQSSLRTLLKIPKDYSIFFLSSATEAFERIIQNCAEAKSFHLVNGAFSKRWFDIAKELGKNSTCLNAELGNGFDLSNLPVPKDAELICLTHNETSSGVMLEGDKISELKQRHGCLVAVDIVSSAPYLKFDISKIDCAFFSVQKGFGLPAGLAVLIVSPEAINKAQALTKAGKSTGSYHNFSSLLEFNKKNQTPETPNVLAIYLLSKAAEQMCAYTLPKIEAETEKKAAILYNLCAKVAWLKPFVKEELLRSKTSIVLELNGKTCKELLPKLAQKGVHVGSGYKPFEDRHIRIANFPAHSLEQIEFLAKLLAEIN